MKKKRVIPVLLLKNGWLVQSKGFRHYQNLGNPVTSAKRLSEWASDELIYLDISRDEVYDLRRDDLGHSNRQTFLEIIEDVSKVTFMPMTVGGRVKTLADIEKRLAAGADKVSINSQAVRDKNFISNAVKEFGSQCVVISIDFKKNGDKFVVMSDGGTKETRYSPLKWAKIAEELGAGEILLNSIDRDGARTGYEIDVIAEVAEGVKIPVIACGGVGEWAHFAEALDKTKADAVAAANIFQYTDQSVYFAKKYLRERGYNVRPPDLFNTIH